MNGENSMSNGNDNIYMRQLEQLLNKPIFESSNNY